MFIKTDILGRLVLVIFHFIMHTVKIISVYVHVSPKPHINVLYFLNENEKKVVLYFKNNEITKYIKITRYK